MAQSNVIERTRVRTTLPIIPPLTTPILTQRLILRTLTLADGPALHAIRSQPDVMAWSRIGVPDPDLQTTQDFLSAHLSLVGSFDFAILERSTGELIGSGGVSRIAGELGWPTMGYKFRKEAWGKGYGTEFVRGFLQAWWSLERKTCEIDVDRSTVRSNNEVTEEIIIAGVIDGNVASENILKKTGFRFVKTWEAGWRDNEPPLTVREFAASQQDLI